MATTEKPSRNILWLLAIFAALLALGWICSRSGSSTPSPRVAPPAAPVTRQVTYQVTGSARRVAVTYENDQGGTEQRDTAVPFSWTGTFAPGDFAYISAQNQGAGGSVTCHILVDGIEWKTSTSRGAYVIATCSGSVGGD